MHIRADTATCSGRSLSASPALVTRGEGLDPTGAHRDSTLVPNSSNTDRPVAFRPPAVARVAIANYQRLLDFDRCTGLFELLLEILGLVLGKTFLDVDRRAFHHVLGLLQSQ